MSTEAVVRKTIECSNRGDADTVSALLHDDIRYCIHAHAEMGPYHTDCAGKGAFSKAIEWIQSDWKIDDYRLTDIIVSGDRAAAQISVKVTSRHTDASRETELALFFTVKDDRVVELHEYSGIAAATRAR